MAHHVLLDLRMVRGRMHGIARYALELACWLPRLAPDLRFSALTPPGGLPGDLGPLHPEGLALVRAGAPWLSPLEQPALLAALLREAPSLFHATSFSLPALWPGRLVATLHDANHLALEEHASAGQRAYYRLLVGPRARTARALVTISEHSRAQLAEHLGLSPFRLQVIPQGVGAHFTPPAPSAVAELRRRLALPPRYFLAVGNAKAYKNLALLAQVARRLPAPLVVLAGEADPAPLGLPAGTPCLREVAEEDLPALYGGALALLFPSRAEGFGLPALEAMASGCPVLAARAGALPEAVGEAGVLLSPDAPDAWAEAAGRLARDEAERARLAGLGRERAARYTWEACARRTLAVYRRALGEA